MYDVWYFFKNQLISLNNEEIPRQSYRKVTRLEIATNE